MSVCCEAAESISMVRTKNQSSSSSASSSTKSPAKISGGGGGGGSGSGNNRSRSCSDALIDDGKSSSKLSSNRQRSSGTTTTTTTTTIASTPGSSPDDDTTDADLTPTSGNAPRSSGGNSVHKQNLYVVSFPIIFLFNVLRSLIYQLFCIFRYLYGASTKVIYRSPHRRDCNIEIVVQNSKEQHQQALICPLERGDDDGSIESQRAQHILPQRRLQPLEMSGNRGGGSGGSSGYSPGPGDPLLAKQKHHHRRAFEYISKALKIDEENEGKYICTYVWVVDKGSPGGRRGGRFTLVSLTISLCGGCWSGAS